MKKYKVRYKQRRPHFVLNAGSTQDPRTTIIGKTRYNKDVGTFFDMSPFVTAITTPGTIVILDELSRGHPEFWNLVLPVLDEMQRTLRLDEAIGGDVVKVAEGVTFIATANVGSEYTATRVMDAALLDRFSVKIEMDFLSQEEEVSLINLKYPSLGQSNIEEITGISHLIRGLAKQGKIGSGISTRSVLEMASLRCDGFTLSEVAQMVVFSDYPNDGDLDSERTIVKQAVQKFVPIVSGDLPSGPLA